MRGAAFFVGGALVGLELGATAAGFAVAWPVLAVALVLLVVGVAAQEPGR